MTDTTTPAPQRKSLFMWAILGVIGLVIVVGAIFFIMQDDDSNDDEETNSAPQTTPVPTVTANQDWMPVEQINNDVLMVLVPPGCFTMGSDDGRRDERPAHEICFDKAFWMDKYEVTNAQYGSDGPFEGPEIPRGNLNWYEARDYCLQRGGRLPTEAEWEYAARGLDGLLFPWGETYDQTIIVIDGDASANVEPVGSYPANASWVGAMDMIGNAFEWVSSAYSQYPYDATDGREDMNDTESRRVYRGGRSAYQEWGVHTTTRFWLEPDNRDWFIGFRCIQDT